MRREVPKLYRKSGNRRQQNLPCCGAEESEAPQGETRGTTAAVPTRTCYTLGHSTRTLDEFCDLLEEHGIAELVDVRSFPGSRRYPHFNAPELERELGRRGIGYTHLAGLGGRRKPRSSAAGFWRTEGFRGYAEYMQTAEFKRALDALERLIDQGRTAIVCSEAVPWRCHRQLISDALTTHGVAVLHIMGPRQVRPHQLHGHARVADDGTVVYVTGNAQ